MKNMYPRQEGGGGGGGMVLNEIAHKQSVLSNGI
jgi:hypothetical protein